jgi:hypothetical protein
MMLPPADISFVPLKQTQTFRADELMDVRRAPRSVCVGVLVVWWWLCCAGRGMQCGT